VQSTVTDSFGTRAAARAGREPFRHPRNTPLSWGRVALTGLSGRRIALTGGRGRSAPVRTRGGSVPAAPGPAASRDQARPGSPAPAPGGGGRPGDQGSSPETRSDGRAISGTWPSRQMRFSCPSVTFRIVPASSIEDSRCSSGGGPRWTAESRERSRSGSRGVRSATRHSADRTPPDQFRAWRRCRSRVLSCRALRSRATGPVRPRRQPRRQVEPTGGHHGFSTPNYGLSKWNVGDERLPIGRAGSLGMWIPATVGGGRASPSAEP